MKKLLPCLLSALLIFAMMVGLTACDLPGWLSWLDWSPKITIEEGTIEFCKNMPKQGEEAELYEGDTFEINNTIYIHVSFTVKNTYKAKEGNEMDFVDLEVRIPYAQYLSSYDCIAGTGDLFEKNEEVSTPDGGKTAVLSGGSVSIARGKKENAYREYYFAIRALQPCDNMAFELSVTAQEKDINIKNGNLRKEYSFIDPATENEGGEVQ